MEREDTDGSLSVEVETDGFGPEIGNVLINCQGRDFCFGVFNLCVVLVLFSTVVPCLLQSNMESLDTVIQLSVNDLRAQKEPTGDVD